MNSSKTKVIVSVIIQKIQMIAGICSILFGIIGFFVDMGKFDSMDAFLIPFFIVIGVMLIFFSTKRKKLIKNYKRYAGILPNIPTGSINTLALTLGTSQNIVKENLIKMIDKKYFTNSYIDYKNNCIVFLDCSNFHLPQTNTQKNISTIQQNTSRMEVGYTVITGENNRVVNKIKRNKVSECKHCSSPTIKKQ